MPTKKKHGYKKTSSPSRADKKFKDAENYPSTAFADLLKITSMSKAKLWLEQNPEIKKLLDETREGKAVTNQLRHRGMFENPEVPHWPISRTTKQDFEARIDNVFGYHNNNDIIFYLEVLDVFPNNGDIRQGLQDLKNNSDMLEKNQAVLEKILGITKSTARKPTEYIALEDFALLEYNYADLFYKKLREKYISLAAVEETLPQHILDRFKESTAHFERAWIKRPTTLETLKRRIISRLPFKNREAASKTSGMFDILSPTFLEKPQRSHPISTEPSQKLTPSLNPVELIRITKEEQWGELKDMRAKNERKTQEPENVEQWIKKNEDAVNQELYGPDIVKKLKDNHELEKQKIAQLSKKAQAEIDHIMSYIHRLESMAPLDPEVKENLLKQISEINTNLDQSKKEIFIATSMNEENILRNTQNERLDYLHKKHIKNRIVALKEQIKDAESNATVEHIKEQININFEGLPIYAKNEAFKAIPKTQKRLIQLADKTRTEANREIAQLEHALTQKHTVPEYNVNARIMHIQARDQKLLKDPNTTIITDGLKGLKKHNEERQDQFNRQIALAVGITAAVVIAAIFVAVAIFAPPAISVIGPLAWKGLMLGIGAAASFLTGLGTYFMTKKALAPEQPPSTSDNEEYVPAARPAPVQIHHSMLTTPLPHADKNSSEVSNHKKQP